MVCCDHDVLVATVIEGHGVNDLNQAGVDALEKAPVRRSRMISFITVRDYCETGKTL